jgi:glycosyltransferase involved in cell wall biosynthesis
VGHVRLSITPRQIETYGMAGCAAVVCVSEAVRSLFAGTRIEGRVHVIYNGVPLDAFTPGFAPLPETAGWPAEALVVGLLGLVSERKNQLVALEGVARAAARGADVRIVLAGDPFKSSEAYGNQVRARIAQPDLAGRVVWLPFQKEVVPIYRALHLNLLISSEEGFGRTIIEAGAMGIPSIGTRVGGIPELIEDGRTGWLVPERDPDALAATLVEAARDRAAVRARGDAARIRVGERFTSGATVRQLTELWSRTIAAGPPEIP